MCLFNAVECQVLPGRQRRVLADRNWNATHQHHSKHHHMYAQPHMHMHAHNLLKKHPCTRTHIALTKCSETVVNSVTTTTIEFVRPLIGYSLTLVLFPNF